MADDDQNAPTGTATTPAAPATQPAPTTPAPRMFSEAEAVAMANSAAAAARREAEGRAKVTPPTAQPKAEPPATPQDLAASDVERRIEFEAGLRWAAKEHKWTPEVVSKIKTLYRAETPSDVDGWLDQTAKLFGGGAVSTPVTPAAATSQPAAPSTPTVPAPIAPSAPSTAVPLERDVDILSMDAAGVHELMRRKGASDPSRPYDPKNRAGRREVRKAFEAAMSSRRVVLGSQK